MTDQNTSDNSPQVHEQRNVVSLKTGQSKRKEKDKASRFKKLKQRFEGFLSLKPESRQVKRKKNRNKRKK